MRFLSFHVASFTYTVTKEGRSSIKEPLTEENQKQTVDNALVLFISVEKSDESDPNIILKTINEIKKISQQLKIFTVMLLPFAHLFGELSSLKFSYETLKILENELNSNNFSCLRAPFGYFNEIDMKAKGHPLSRISRIIN